VVRNLRYPAEGVMATAVAELAAHLFDVHALLPAEALAEAQGIVLAGKTTCEACEVWLRRQLEGLGK